MPRLDVIAASHRVFDTLLDVRFLWRATGTWLILETIVGWSTLALGRSGFSGGASVVIALSAYVVQAVGLTACAVNVHRFVLLAEQPTPLRAGWIEWRYLRRGLWVSLPTIFLLAAATIIVIFPFPILSDLLGSWKRAIAEPLWSFAHILALLGYEVSIGLLILPFFLSLPAVAIGNVGFTMTDGIEAISGNFLRLLTLFLIAVAFPTTIVEFVTGGVESGLPISAAQPSFMESAILVPLETARQISFTVIWAAMLSYAHAGFIGRDEEFASRAIQ
ncbi:MAG: hypothetical protein JWL84_5698 [Rhodospirillales bacterium]|nr:hypothetical protein [Rhodospirillales bacterium]